MLTLTNNDHPLSILGETLSCPDLQFLTEDGSFSTSKLIMFSSFPLLSSFLCEACTTSHSMVTIMLPGVQTRMVEQAVKMMCQQGNAIMMETILGISVGEKYGDQRGSTSIEYCLTKEEQIVAFQPD